MFKKIEKKSQVFFLNKDQKMHGKSKIKSFTANETILDIFKLYEVVLE